eukprot:7765406-Lingulodinium_polyedra.AAC.1
MANRNHCSGCPCPPTARRPCRRREPWGSWSGTSPAKWPGTSRTTARAERSLRGLPPAIGLQYPND